MPNNVQELLSLAPTHPASFSLNNQLFVENRGIRWTENDQPGPLLEI